MPTLPTGTVTFLFTDIEGSTRLTQQHPAAWPAAKARHHALMRAAIEAHSGYVFQVIGDAFCAAFHTAPDALAAALDAQRALNTEPWGDSVVRVRMGLHTGSATARPDGDYEGYLTLVRVQRIMSGAYGGQVLMSQDVADLVGRDLPPGVTLHDLGTHRLKDLTAPEHLQQLVASNLPADFPPLKTADHPNNLPTQLTSFIGREAEVAEVRRLLGGSRFLTLMGVGGIGKTRLALQVAAEEMGARATRPYLDGVWFVDLASLADPVLIPSTIASAVGVREEPNRPMLATLGDHFHAKTALIVLDNCEHLVADTALLCDALLRAAPNLNIIATSRESLGIAGEHAYRVPSLRVPPDLPDPKGLANPSGFAAQYESVSLFVERAQAARSDFLLTRANAAAVTQLCRRLDGIPLAIELAAARVRSLTVEQIATRLDDRFRILTGGSRTALPRQQTLRATIDWSYRLLSEPEKTLLRRLSVFAGGWTLEAAEEVCSEQATVNGQPSTVESPLRKVDILELLSHLVDRSLVILDESGGEPRYRMLETIRQFAREALDQTDEAAHVRSCHLDYFVDFSPRISRDTGDESIAVSLRYVVVESDNLHAALTWAKEQDPSSGLRLLDAIVIGLRTLGRGKEAYEWLVSLLERDSGVPTPARGQACRWASYFAASLLADYAAAQRLANESIAIYRSLGDTAGLARALAAASTAFSESAPAQAESCLHEALQLAEHAGDPRLEALVLMEFGAHWRSRGNDAEAQRCYERGVTICRKIPRRLLTGMCLGSLALVVLHRNDHQNARAYLQEALTIGRDLGSPPLIVTSFVGLAGVATALGNAHDAARLFGCATAARDVMKSPLELTDRADFDRYLALARAQSDPVAFEAAFAEGCAMSPDEAIAYALEVSRE